MPSRLIVSQTNTLLFFGGKYVNFLIETVIIPYITTQVKDTLELCEQLITINDLPKDARLFTVDAVSAYIYTDTIHAHQTLIKWL